MTAREADLYRWFEVFTLTDGALSADSWEYRLCVERGMIHGGKLTEKGAKWYDVRAEAVRNACNNGDHEYAPKTVDQTAAHCRWCGRCEQTPCPVCTAEKQERGIPQPELRYKQGPNGLEFIEG